MNRKLAPSKVALGQVFLLLGVLTCAKVLGFIPDQDERIIAGRAAVCEAVGMNSAQLVRHGEIERLEKALARAVDRSPGMLSAGVRRRDGSLVAQASDHGSRWKRPEDDRSNDVQIQVPIWMGQERWGRVEYCFEPLAYTGKHAWLNPWLLHTVFVLAASYVVFTLYLGKRSEDAMAPKVASRNASKALSGLADERANEGQTFDLSVALTRPATAAGPPRERRRDTIGSASGASLVPPTYDQRRITSSLPAEDPEFCEIVRGFVETLGVRILELHAAWDRRDLAEVSRLAHWIKGSGGTVGFNDLTHPAMTLQEAAQQGDCAAVESAIAEIIGLYQRISISADAVHEDALA